MSNEISEVSADEHWVRAKVGHLSIEVKRHLVRDPTRPDEYKYIHDGRWCVQVYTDEVSCGGNCGYSDHYDLADYIMGERDAAAIVAARWAMAALSGGAE